MKRKLTVIGVVALATIVLAGCNSKTIHTDLDKNTPELRGPKIKKVESPYEAAMHCVAALPNIHTIPIGVGSIVDATGKYNTGTESSTGSFVSQGASHMMMTSLNKLGVQAMDMSATYRRFISWYRSIGVNTKIAQGRFMIEGAVTSLGLNKQSSVRELKAFGVGPGTRVFKSKVRMDTKTTAMPYAPTRQTGGKVVAWSAVNKEVVGVESKFGINRVVGGGSGLTLLSMNFGQSEREMLQEVIGSQTDYMATDQILQLYEKRAMSNLLVSEARLAECRELLDQPYASITKSNSPTTHANKK